MPDLESDDSLLRLIESTGGIHLSDASGQPPDGWTTSGVRAGIGLSVARQMANSELIAVRDSVLDAFQAADQMARISRENDLLAGQLVALLAVLELDIADDTEIPSMFAFLPEGCSWAVLKDGLALYRDGVDDHSLRIEARRMQARTEHRCDIGDGERFVYRSEPYVVIVDSPVALDQVRRRLVRLTLAQLSTRHQEREQHELLERVRALIAAERPTDGAVSASGDAGEIVPGRGSGSEGSSVENDVSRLIEATVTDSLTRIYNRSKTTSVIDELIAGGRDYSIVMADIDRFKSVNDTYGHQVGDRVIVEVAACLDGDRRGDDVVARWGGEEFIAVLPELSMEQALGKAERWRARIASTVAIDGRTVTCSFGVAEWSPGKSADELVAEADRALYRAKGRGRNRVEVALAPLPTST